MTKLETLEYETWNAKANNDQNKLDELEYLVWNLKQKESKCLKK